MKFGIILKILMLLMSASAFAQTAEERQILIRARAAVSAIHAEPKDEHSREFRKTIAEIAALENPSYEVIQFLVVELRNVNSNIENVHAIAEEAFETLVTIGRRQRPNTRFLLREALMAEIEGSLKTQLKAGINVPTELLIRFVLPHPAKFNGTVLPVTHPMQKEYEAAAKLVGRVMLEAPSSERMLVVNAFHETLFQYELGGSEWYDKPTPALETTLKLQETYLILYRLDGVENYINAVNRGEMEFKNSSTVSTFLREGLDSEIAEVRSRALYVSVLLVKSGIDQVLSTEDVRSCFFPTANIGDLALQNELRNLLGQRKVELAPPSLPSGRYGILDNMEKTRQKIEAGPNPIAESSAADLDVFFHNLKSYAEDVEVVAKFLTLIELAQKKGYDISGHIALFDHLKIAVRGYGDNSIARRLSIITFSFDRVATPGQLCADPMLGKRTH